MDFSLNYSAWKVCFNLIDFINRITYSFYVCNEDFIVRVVDIIYQGLNKTLFPRFFSADLLKLFQGILTEYMVISSIWKYKASFFKKNSCNKIMEFWNQISEFGISDVNFLHWSHKWKILELIFRNYEQ